ncbi:MAG: sialidase family protein [Polyangiaceae bacterium]|nr:sialidase family protein [Polyangiaceae bacterium]
MLDQLLLATKKGTLIFDRENGSWKPRPISHPGLAVSYVARDPRDGTIWACMDNAHWGPALSRSKDDGVTWEDTSRIAYPKGARYIEQLIPSPETMAAAERPIQYKPAVLMKVWSLGFAGEDQPGVIHAGTLPGGLFTTRDGGESWELNRPLWNHESRGGDLFAGEATSKNQWGGTPAAMAYGDFVPGIHSVVVDPRDSNHFYVAVSCAGVAETRDGGKTWAGCNRGMLNDYLPNPEAAWGHDPHLVTLCPGQPNRLWQQNHSGVFTSEDGAGTWKRVSKPEVAVHFGFPIAADSNSGNTAWVVPLRGDQERMTVGGGLFVARTDDAGGSWQVFRKGLPQENCYDVVYRHALDASGDRVCFGSTTGNVYMSEDRGETWSCLGNHLPPIHSVRFA